MDQETTGKNLCGCNSVKAVSLVAVSNSVVELLVQIEPRPTLGISPSVGWPCFRGDLETFQRGLDMAVATFRGPD